MHVFSFIESSRVALAKKNVVGKTSKGISQSHKKFGAIQRKPLMIFVCSRSLPVSVSSFLISVETLEI